MTNGSDQPTRPSARRPDCPSWCTQHDFDSDIHFGVVHTVELEQEERGIGLRVEEVLGDADDPGQPPLVHLQQSVGRDGVNVMPDEADALGALLSRLAEQARDGGHRPTWCENREDRGSDAHDHRGRVYHYDADAYAFTAAMEAWDDGDGELSDLHVALSLTTTTTPTPTPSPPPWRRGMTATASSATSTSPCL